MESPRCDPPPLRCPCDGSRFSRVFSYDAPPRREIRFRFAAAGPYRREILRCDLCGHFVSLHRMDATALYAGDYVSSTYGPNGIGQAFEHIVALDPAKSDNVGRVRRINAFADRYFSSRPNGSRTVLDVGSGLGVFVHGMKAQGWTCTALDPDSRAVRHAAEVVGVTAVQGDFMQANRLGRFDLVTFNKVLEHVADPVGLLARAHTHVAEGGLVYVEVPDGETAAAAGPEREEFFIDHLHIFSAASLALLAVRAGLVVDVLERLWEPSGKYTLWAFLIPASPAHVR